MGIDSDYCEKELMGIIYSKSRISKNNHIYKKKFTHED